MNYFKMRDNILGKKIILETKVSYLDELEEAFKYAKISPIPLKKFALRELRKEAWECCKILMRHHKEGEPCDLDAVAEYARLMKRIEDEMRRMKEWKSTGM